MAEGLASVHRGSGVFPWAQNELPPWLLPSPWMPEMVPPWATLALQRERPTQGPYSHRCPLVHRALEAAEGEGKRPWSPPRGQNFGEVLDKGENKGWGGRGHSSRTEGLSNRQRGPTSRLKSLGTPPGERAVHLLDPTACRRWGRPEQGLPGREGSGTLISHGGEEASEGSSQPASPHQPVLAQELPGAGRTG